MKNVFLDLLQEKIVDAEKRFQTATSAIKEGQAEFQAATQKFQKIQMEHNIAAAEFNSLKTLIDAETRKAASATQAHAAPAGQSAVPPKPEVVVSASMSEQSGTEVNKTELIRDLLRSHPTGMTPVEVWRIVKEQIPHRAYVYGVLGRLKDRDQVTVNKRSGKYFFRISSKPEEVKPQTISVQ